MRTTPVRIYLSHKLQHLFKQINAKEFVKHALDISMDGTKVAMFLKVQFLEGKARRELFKKYPPKVIYVASSRLLCAKNGEFEKMRQGGGSAVAYAWFIWEKGYKDKTTIGWPSMQEYNYIENIQ